MTAWEVKGQLTCKLNQNANRIHLSFNFFSFFTFYIYHISHIFL